MTWIVRTKFYAGIFWSKKKTEKYAGAEVKEFQCYADAIEKITEIIQSSDYSQKIKEIRPNRMYQIKDKKIYQVVYNRKKVGFFDEDRLARYLNRTGESLELYKVLGMFDYTKAVQWVTRIGAKTGKTDILDRANPVCGRMYLR